MPTKKDRSFLNKIEYVKNTMEIEGYRIDEDDLRFLQEIEDNKYTDRKSVV